MKTDTQIEWISFDYFGTLGHYTKAWWFIFMLRAGLFSKSSREIFQKGVLESVTTNLYLDDIIFRENNFSHDVAHLFEKYLQDELSSIRLYSDVAGPLKYLKSRGYKIAITSNLARDFGKPALDLLPIVPDATVLSYEIAHRKPEPEIFQELLRKTGVSPEEILHIGDKCHNDYTAPRQMGIRAFFLSRDNTKMIPHNVHTIKSLHELEWVL